MQTLSIKQIVEFRSKSDRSKKNFILALKLDKSKADADGGGNYWISCLSAISNSYKTNDTESIIDKRIELEDKYGDTEYKRTKTMYKRNIDILYNYEDFDLKKWRPSRKIEFVRKHKDDSILTVKGLKVQATPNHVFKFIKNDKEQVGAIWFIAKLGGFKQDELGMFTDILFRYLEAHYTKNHMLNPKYCIAVDVFNKTEVNFSQIESGEVSSLLNATLDEIRKVM